MTPASDTTAAYADHFARTVRDLMQGAQSDDFAVRDDATTVLDGFALEVTYPPLVAVLERDEYQVRIIADAMQGGYMLEVRKGDERAYRRGEWITEMARYYRQVVTA